MDEGTRLDFMGLTPIRDSMEIRRKRGVAEDLGLLVLSIFGEGEGVVCSSTAAKDEESVAQVFTKLRITGGGGWWRRRRRERG